VVLANAGRPTPGLNGLTKKHRDRRTDGRPRLSQERHAALLTETDRPPPVTRVDIPKAKGQWRPLGMACLRDRAVHATVKMVLEPSDERVCPPGSWGVRPLRSIPHALSALRRGPADPQRGCTWVIAGDRAACVDAIDPRLLRRVLKKRRHDQRRLDLITRLLRCGRGAEGRVSDSPTGTAPGAGRRPVRAKVCWHEFDEG
jgi:RNA-directed DNA polymerase